VVLRQISLAAFFCAAATFCVAQNGNPFPGEPPAAPATQQQQQDQQQNPFPGEPTAQPQQASQQQPQSQPEVSAAQIVTPTIRVNTTVVLVPTLVENPSGEIIYGLKPGDFTLLDNGVPQKLHVDDELDTAPVSLVVCVQRSRDATLEFDKFARLGPFLQLFTGAGIGEAALVVFDSKPQYLDPFNQDTSNIERDLQNLTPGDGGAAILDAASFSLNLLEQTPPDHRRVLLLISETRDHGSRHVNIPELVERIGTSNTLVFSISFSPARTEGMEGLKGHSIAGADIGLLGPVLMAMNGVRRNVPKALAEMTGGEYEPFAREKAFEDRIAEAARHAHNRYLLSFHPVDPAPGLHTLDVKLTQNYAARIVARASYWAINSDAPNPATTAPAEEKP
jgi:VWFA-related protein